MSASLQVVGGRRARASPRDTFFGAGQGHSVESTPLLPRTVRPQHRTVGERLAVLHRLLVDDPRGWDESGVVGSVRYSPQDLAAFTDPGLPVLIFVGRFTHPGRLPLLLRAYARARREHGLRLGGSRPLSKPPRRRRRRARTHPLANIPPRT